MKTNKIETWAEENFGTVQLYDRRRTKRLINIAWRLAENKGKGRKVAWSFNQRGSGSTGCCAPALIQEQAPRF